MERIQSCEEHSTVQFHQKSINLAIAIVHENRAISVLAKMATSDLLASWENTPEPMLTIGHVSVDLKSSRSLIHLAARVPTSRFRTVLRYVFGIGVPSMVVYPNPQAPVVR